MDQTDRVYKFWPEKYIYWNQGRANKVKLFLVLRKGHVCRFAAKSCDTSLSSPAPPCDITSPHATSTVHQKNVISLTSSLPPLL